MYFLVNQATHSAALTFAGFYPLRKPPERPENSQKPRFAGLWQGLISLGFMASALRLATPVSCVAAIPCMSSHVTLAWDPSPDPSVVGYQIYYGEQSGVYPHFLETGSETTATIGGLCPGITYYFAATALNASGLQSDFSNEASYTIPPEKRDLQMMYDPNRGLVLKGSGQFGGSYLIMASPDLVNWAVTDTVYLDQSEVFEVAIPIRTNWPGCFFQMRPTAGAVTTAPVVK